jgi:hypothetical protein
LRGWRHATKVGAGRGGIDGGDHLREMVVRQAIE